MSEFREQQVTCRWRSAGMELCAVVKHNSQRGVCVCHHMYIREERAFWKRVCTCVCVCACAPVCLMFPFTFSFMSYPFLQKKNVPFIVVRFVCVFGVCFLVQLIVRSPLLPGGLVPGGKSCCLLCASVVLYVSHQTALTTHSSLLPSLIAK